MPLFASHAARLHALGASILQPARWKTSAAHPPIVSRPGPLEKQKNKLEKKKGKRKQRKRKKKKGKRTKK
jgi:hypothetical protein